MSFGATVTQVGRDRTIVPVPFDPDQVWGPKPRHHVAGTVNGVRVRAVIETVSESAGASDEAAAAQGYGFVLGAARRRDCAVAPGDHVLVEISPEGPQRADLPDDVAAALEADPAAGRYFDSLAQFYRKGFLRWIDATRRNPELRAERIATVVRLLAEGRKTRPTPGEGTPAT